MGWEWRGVAWHGVCFRCGCSGLLVSDGSLLWDGFVYKLYKSKASIND